MSTYGLIVKDSGGNITLDVDEKINRVRHTHEATATESDSVTLSDIDGLLTVQIPFAINITTPYQCPHAVTRSGNTISWAPLDWGYTVKMPSLILTFIYV